MVMPQALCTSIGQSMELDEAGLRKIMLADAL
jgi:hypothetical protein